MARLTVPGRRHRLLAGAVGNAAAAIFRIVGIEDLAIETRFRHADAVADVGEGREVANHDQVIVWVTSAAQESDHRVVGIVEIDPFKTLPFKIDFVQ